MKKTFYYIAAAVLALGLASCAKEAMTPEQPATPEVIGQMTIVANIEDGGSTKATLSGDDQSGYQVLWSEGDQIILVKQSNVSITAVYTLSNGAGSTSGTFVGATLTDGDYMAYYAYDRAQPLKFGEQTSNSEQSVSHAPMTAKFTVSGGVPSSIVFRNACGLLCLNLKGAGTVKNITITTNEGLVSRRDSFAEDGSMNVPNPPMDPALKSITLDCGSSGRKLTESYQSFYIAMPPGDYTGVRIDVSDFANHKFTKELKAGKALNIARAQITPASFTVTGLTNDNVPLTKDSPEGTIGVIEGREAMVVDLGGTIGKVAIATKNIGASSATAAGSYYNFVGAKAALVTSGGWYVPSKDELTALIGIPSSHVGSCQEWVIGTGDNQHKLYFNWAGWYDNNGNKTDGYLFYWSGTEDPSKSTRAYCTYGNTLDLLVMPYNKESRFQVRPFHKLD